MVGWSSDQYKTMSIRPVQTTVETRRMKNRMRDALIERCLAGSGLQPVDGDADLTLDTELVDYNEYILSTGSDGRTERLQFTLIANFKLKNKAGDMLWQLKNYQYSDQYAISTGNSEYRNENVYTQDKAMRTIADQVITNISLAITEFEAK